MKINMLNLQLEEDKQERNQKKMPQRKTIRNMMDSIRAQRKKIKLNKRNLTKKEQKSKKKKKMHTIKKLVKWNNQKLKKLSKS